MVWWAQTRAPRHGTQTLAPPLAALLLYPHHYPHRSFTRNLPTPLFCVDSAGKRAFFIVKKKRSGPGAAMFNNKNKGWRRLTPRIETVDRCAIDTAAAFVAMFSSLPSLAHEKKSVINKRKNTQHTVGRIALSSPSPLSHSPALFPYPRPTILHVQQTNEIRGNELRAGLMPFQPALLFPPPLPPKPFDRTDPPPMLDRPVDRSAVQHPPSSRSPLWKKKKRHQGGPWLGG